MAASPVQRPNGPCTMLAFGLLLIASLLTAGAMAQETEVPTGVVTSPPTAVEETTQDSSPETTAAPELHDSQVIVLPTPGPQDLAEQTTAAATEAATTPAATDDEGQSKVEELENKEGIVKEEDMKKTDVFTVQTTIIKIVETPAPLPPRGDGPSNTQRLVPLGDVVCVSKEAVQDKNAVNLKLKAPSSCKDTKVRIESVLKELCGEDCKLDIYQEDNTDEIIVSGKYVEDDVPGMTDKFNNDNIKDKTEVEEAVPRWGKNSKLVLVSLLLAGLLLAALLVAGYYLKTHRKSSKGVRLAESFQVDEENQANTLVSVAPLPQEPLDKPTVNGDSPPENGTNATTNGHSATQTPVADTEM